MGSKKAPASLLDEAVAMAKTGLHRDYHAVELALRAAGKTGAHAALKDPLDRRRINDLCNAARRQKAGSASTTPR